MAIRWAWAILPLLATSTSVAAQNPYAAVKKGTLHQPTMMVPGVVTPAPPGAIDPPPPCTPPAIRLAAANHVMPDLLNCTYDQVQSWLEKFDFKPSRLNQPNSAVVGTIVDQAPGSGSPMGDGQLNVYVAAPEPPPTPTTVPAQPVVPVSPEKPHIDPPVHPQPTPAPPPCSAPDDNGCILYPPWVRPSAIGLGIVLIAGLLWWAFHKPNPDPNPTPHDDTEPPNTFVPPNIHGEMEPEAPHLTSAGPLAETPHLLIRINLEPEPPRASDIAIEREELYRDR